MPLRLSAIGVIPRAPANTPPRSTPIRAVTNFLIGFHHLLPLLVIFKVKMNTMVQHIPERTIKSTNEKKKS